MTKLTDGRTYIALMLVSFLCGCANAPHDANSPGNVQTAAAQSAEKYLQMAGKKDNSNAAINLRLRAAEQYIVAGRPDQARAILAQDNSPRLNSENTAFKNILQAQLALASSDFNAAQKYLNSIWTPLKLPENLKIKFYDTRAEVYSRSGRLVESLHERVFLGQHLKSADDQRKNNQQIWDTLNRFQLNTLNSLQQLPNKDELNGWITFATIMKQNEDQDAELVNQLAIWQEKYPEHPAISFAPENILPADAVPTMVATQNYAPSFSKYTGRAIKSPGKIALLLPLQGAQAKAAQAVRDGFLAAYSEQLDNANKPTIQVYDSSTSVNLSEVYQQSIDDGAEFIVGPLMKEEVEQLKNSSRIRVPVLALNIIPDNRSQENMFHFGLSPEMEARAVADKAWRDGRRSALVITPKSAWGQRMYTAFTQHWQQLGGVILASEEIQSQSNLNKEIQHLLAIDTSEARAKQLKQLGLKFSFDTRRRQDPDMIFIATNSALARQVKPLLNFYYASNIATYASSSVFSGKSQPTLDQDLNGIQFCDMPWVLDRSLQNSRSAQNATFESGVSDFENYSRLYALGLDAYKIALQIDELTAVPELGLKGVTGTLTLDNDQNIQRNLTWASFRHGTPYIQGR